MRILGSTPQRGQTLLRTGSPSNRTWMHRVRIQAFTTSVGGRTAQPRVDVLAVGAGARGLRHEHLAEAGQHLPRSVACTQ